MQLLSQIEPCIRVDKSVGVEQADGQIEGLAQAATKPLDLIGRDRARTPPRAMLR